MMYEMMYEMIYEMKYIVIYDTLICIKMLMVMFKRIHPGSNSQVGFALVFCQALQPVILDPSTEDSTRREVNRALAAGWLLR